LENKKFLQTLILGVFIWGKIRKLDRVPIIRSIIENQKLADSIAEKVATFAPHVLII